LGRRGWYTSTDAEGWRTESALPTRVRPPMKAVIKRIAVVLWAALVAFLVADPSVATAVGRKGIAACAALRGRVRRSS
jgi:hypothetical protein